LPVVELSIDNRGRTADDERRCRVVDGDVCSAADDRVAEVVCDNGSVETGRSHCDVGTTRQEVDSQPVSTCVASSPGSPTMRHSASDSMVYRADVELASSSCEVLPDCRHTDDVLSSAGQNGSCHEEASISQVGVVTIC